jgi:hypothetical protein
LAATFLTTQKPKTRARHQTTQSLTHSIPPMHPCRVVARKRFSNFDRPVQHRLRLVSCSHPTFLTNSTHLPRDSRLQDLGRSVAHFPNRSKIRLPATRSSATSTLTHRVVVQPDLRPTSLLLHEHTTHYHLRACCIGRPLVFARQSALRHAALPTTHLMSVF